MANFEDMYISKRCLSLGVSKEKKINRVFIPSHAWNISDQYCSPNCNNCSVWTLWLRSAGSDQTVQQMFEVPVRWVKRSGQVSSVVLIEQLNSVLKMNNLTQHVTQSVGCQLISCGYVTKYVVISNYEDFATCCHSRHLWSDKSSVSQLRTVPSWTNCLSYQKLPAVKETKIPSPLSQQRTTFPYPYPD